MQRIGHALNLLFLQMKKSDIVHMIKTLVFDLLLTGTDEQIYLYKSTNIPKNWEVQWKNKKTPLLKHILGNFNVEWA